MVALAATALTVLAYLAIAHIGLGLPAAMLVIVLAVPIAVGASVATRALGRRPAITRGYPAQLAIPSIAFYGLFLAGPLVFLLLYAFGTSLGFGDVQYGVSLENFRQALDTLYVHVFVRTLRMACLGTVLTVLVGFPLAYWMARYAPAHRRSLLVVLVIVPFWTSFLIRTYAFLILLDDSGPLSKAFQSTGLLSHPLHVLYTNGAVQIGLVYNYLPLFVLPAYATLERLDWRLVDAAVDLGASRLRALCQITLPLAAPGLVTGALLVFIPMMGEYVIPIVLGGGRTDLMGSVIGRAFLAQQDYSLGAALGVLVMCVLSVFLILYVRLGRRTESSLAL